MGCLRSGEWLNDEVVNMYMALLQVGPMLCVCLHVCMHACNTPPATCWLLAHYPGDMHMPMHSHPLPVLPVPPVLPVLPAHRVPHTQDRDAVLHSGTDQQQPGQRPPPPRCHFFNTFFLSKLYQERGEYCYANVRRWTSPKKLAAAGHAVSCLLQLDRLVLPVHQGMHWTAALVDLTGQRLVFFDSLGGRDAPLMAALKRWLVDEAQVRCCAM
jgi:Ulp1 protease family, C-terminal catalytic domain